MGVVAAPLGGAAAVFAAVAAMPTSGEWLVALRAERKRLPDDQRHLRTQERLSAGAPACLRRLRACAQSACCSSSLTASMLMPPPGQRQCHNAKGTANAKAEAKANA